MFKLNRITSVALVALAGAGCFPEDYPTEARFDPPPIPIELPDGELFMYTPPAGVAEITSLSIAFVTDTDTTYERMFALADGRWALGLEDLEPGIHAYKYVFNGDQWAGNMCNEGTWGDPDNGGMVDPNGTGCASGGENAVIEVDEAGPHTFMYIVPASAPAITSVNVAGSFQGWSTSATPMDETYALWVDLEEGSYEYKFVFNGDQWAGDMCNDATWGDPDNGFQVDANGQGCVSGGGNAVLTID